MRERQGDPQFSPGVFKRFSRLAETAVWVGAVITAFRLLHQVYPSRAVDRPTS